MYKLPEAEFLKMKARVVQLDMEFELWRPHFQTIATYLLPRRYSWLMNSASPLVAGSTDPAKVAYNDRIFDPSATIAARVLAAGLMNGITSPARPWFRLRIPSADERTFMEMEKQKNIWLEETTRRMLLVLASSNFYSALAIYYLELVGFGTAAMLAYEDFESVVRFYNSPVGEFRLVVDHRGVPVGYCRTFNMQVHQLVSQFGIENCSMQVREKFKQGGPSHYVTIPVTHFIEINRQDTGVKLDPSFSHREYYWERSCADGQLLSIAGYSKNPVIASRWEVLGNDTYGTSPTMDALPEIKQLQLQTKIKAKALDKMVDPPIVADVALQAQPNALLPRGIAYVPSASQVGAKPIYTVNPPLGEMTADILRIQERIKEIYYNNLFRNVSNLQTVRSALEIAERKAEDMVLLGSVIERFESEALDPLLQRVFDIMLRKGLLPPLPEGLDAAIVEVQYVSILADAQRAAATGPIERFLQVVGNLAGLVPEVAKIPDFDAAIREYADRVNVPATLVKSKDQVQAELEAESEQLQLQQAALVGGELTNAAKNLSQTDLGGGQNAMQALLAG